jgi:putative toxin-antitoxin system antitoxin component (TIGR02293 family)
MNNLMWHNVIREEIPMEDIAAVRQYLGGARAIGSPETDLDFVGIIRKGFPVSVFRSLCARANLSEETLLESLGIARRTAARRKREGGRLKPVESELLLRFARVFVAATGVLGSEEKARAWLLAESRALGGREPINLLDTGVGFQDVMDVLKRIEYGVYS